jgi:hypothetical protein
MLRMVVLWLFSLSVLRVIAFRKVVVPAVYKEYEGVGLPDWITNNTTKEKYGYETFLYQKMDPKAPHYIRNRGTEGAVYLRYIVDHYDDFPDVAIFLHGRPDDHQPNWLELVGCLKTTASYMNINFSYMYRNQMRW